MHSHLVSVKVRVKSRTNERMQLNRLAFHQNRLKRLNPQPVQRGCAVQHHGMLLDYLLQHIPYLRIQPLHQLFGVLYILGNPPCHKLLHHKGLKKLDSHFLRETALINFQLRPHHDNGTSGIIHTFSQQVLAEASRLTLEHIGQ